MFCKFIRVVTSFLFVNVEESFDSCTEGTVTCKELTPRFEWEQGIKNSLAMMIKTKTTVINLPKSSYSLG